MQHLYNNYCDAVKDYLSVRILPRIKERHEEQMLNELVRRWENHKLMIKFLSHVFKYLDRFYVKRLSLPELSEVGSQRYDAGGSATACRCLIRDVYVHVERIAWLRCLW